MSILLLLQEKGLLHMERWAGASIGASCAASFAVSRNTTDVLWRFFRAPYAWQAVWRPSEFWKGAPIVRAMVAEGVHDPMPGLSGEPIGTRVFNDTYCVDGGLALNTPTFSDHLRDQLVINLGELVYPFTHTFYPLDTKPELLVQKGQDDVVKFLRGEDVPTLQVLKAEQQEEVMPTYRTSWRRYARHRYRFDVKPWVFIGTRELFAGFSVLGAGCVALVLALCALLRRTTPLMSVVVGSEAPFLAPGLRPRAPRME
jgi:hypothetical protein